MKHTAGTIAVLLTLALPVAGICAVSPNNTEKTDSAVDAIKDSMSKSGHAAMTGGKASGEAATTASGKVVETMESGGYRYVNLEKGGKKSWVAYPSEPASVGEELSFTGCMEMPGFQSKTLNRKFESILFCSAPENKKAKTAKADAMAGKKSPGSTGAVTASSEKIKVEKAAGANAYTVAEIFAKAAPLNGKKVQVRGKVVKVSSGIMDRNWLHLQDGSGDAKKKTHDLVVTTKDSAEVGDVVTVSGTVVKDKDFGSGYKYSVIIEQGSVKK